MRIASIFSKLKHPLAGAALLLVAGCGGGAETELSDNISSGENSPVTVVELSPNESNMSIVAKLPEPSDVIEKITFGASDFQVTYKGDFENSICAAVKDSLTDIPKDVDMIAKVGRKKPFNIFRRDVLYNALRTKDLPFVEWEDVPEKKRDQAIFNAQLGELGRVLRKPRTQDNSGSREFYFQDYDEPKYWSQRHNELSFNENRALRGYEVGSDVKVRRYQITDIHTLYDIRTAHLMTEFSKEALSDWEVQRNPYINSRYEIGGPYLSLKHRFKKGDGEIGVSTNFVDMDHSQISNLVHDKDMLYVISSQDLIRYRTVSEFSVMVTRVNPTEFTTTENIRRNAILLHKSRNRKNRELFKQQITDHNGSPVQICAIKLRPKLTSGE